jgi:hypothetical protein
VDEVVCAARLEDDVDEFDDALCDKFSKTLPHTNPNTSLLSNLFTQFV